MQEAIAFHQQGAFTQAEALYKEVLNLEPRNADAIHLLGVIAHQTGHNQVAVDMISQAIVINPNVASYYCNLGNSLQELKQFESAVANFDKAISIKPDYDKAYSNRGISLKELKQFHAAVISFDKAIALNPDFAEAYTNRGNVLHELKQFDAAVVSFNKAIALKPDVAEVYYNRGISLKELNQYQAAIESYEKALDLKPNFAEAYSNRGNAQHEFKQYETAVASFEKALSLKPDYAEAYYNKGNALQELKKFDVAIASFDKAIALKPDYAEAYSNRGNAYHQLKQYDAAFASLYKAIELKPNYAGSYSNLGNLFHENKQFDAAVASYDKAIMLMPTDAGAYYNRGISLQLLKQIEAALISYNKAISLKPDSAYLIGMRQHAKMLLCDWEHFESNVSEISSKILRNLKASTCLAALALPITLSEQLKVAQTWSEDKYPYNPTLGPLKKSVRQTKIRIGYYSADFRVHPVSILTVGLLENHDKSKFELIAFSFGPDSENEIRGRITKAVDRFIDVRAISDKEVAELSRALGVDIAIDLGGHTQDSRTGIFSFRAAPVQISYIGYLGSMGASYYDYLIADQTLIPQEHLPFYSEKIAYLPSYQVNDNKQKIPNAKFSRQELNLPSSGFIFCCFNAIYKITPSTFDGWMRILLSVPESVLLLYVDVKSATRNLKIEAEKRGVSQNRIIFGEKLIRSQYLARCRSADLFLDTLPYNAGATASDALWAGLPVLTCMGQSFASRYAASLLYAIGLPELVTKSQAEYEALAIELAINPNILKAIKEKLERNRLTTPLFDTPRFARHIEAAYKEMYQRYQTDLPPDHIYITS